MLHPYDTFTQKLILGEALFPLRQTCVDQLNNIDDIHPEAVVSFAENSFTLKDVNIWKTWTFHNGTIVLVKSIIPKGEYYCKSIIYSGLPDSHYIRYAATKIIPLEIVPFNII